MREIIVIAHDIRSTHNVGSLLRTAEGLGVNKVYFTGYTPYPVSKNDTRLPHLAQKITKQIHKTALGAENCVAWQHADNITQLFNELRSEGFQLIALEQNDSATKLQKFIPANKVALLLGREVEGIDEKLLSYCDKIVEIPMFGKKESFNVIQATAMSLYHIRFYPFD